ncbi:9153_t:CDS:1, partial [Cetraspora pellucida]
NSQYKHSTCNKYYKQCKNRQKEVDVIFSKRKQLKTDPAVITGSITVVNSSQTNSYMDLEQDSNAFEDLSSDLLYNNNVQ